ncbi:type II toxin-antitoxin system RelB/DinJ family antitoxin [Vibrio cholerae]|nr:type II toxin-antitoxin system RelB/DinJ family antitoxin [Vibrio cholerae]HEQ3486905.1 type II toxin-antitoxin system RelB/DinJ family antitoxin [Vibrio cholerae]
MDAALKASLVKSRVTKDLKYDAKEILEGCGLTISSAIRVFLEQVVVHEGLPFEVKAKKPSLSTMQALDEAKQIEREFSSIDDMMKGLNSDSEEDCKL